jgi:hypothetical protein
VTGGPGNSNSGIKPAKPPTKPKKSVDPKPKRQTEAGPKISTTSNTLAEMGILPGFV